MDKEVILGLIRHCLTLAGGVLVANGSMSGSDMQGAAGAVVTLTGLIMSVIKNKKKKGK